MNVIVAGRIMTPEIRPHPNPGTCEYVTWLKGIKVAKEGMLLIS